MTNRIRFIHLYVDLLEGTAAKQGIFNCATHSELDNIIRYRWTEKMKERKKPSNQTIRIPQPTKPTKKQKNIEGKNHPGQNAYPRLYPIPAHPRSQTEREEVSKLMRIIKRAGNSATELRARAGSTAPLFNKEIHEGKITSPPSVKDKAGGNGGVQATARRMEESS